MLQIVPIEGGVLYWQDREGFSAVERQFLYHMTNPIGVPQFSVLAPILYLLHMRGIPTQGITKFQRKMHSVGS
jgi:hypothetical protein